MFLYRETQKKEDSMKKLVKILDYVLFAMLLMLQYSFSGEKLNIVTTTTDLADLARNIGGDKVSVISLTKGNQDLHSIEPKPSMIINIKKADILIVVGMDLDLWAKSLVEAARNSKVMIGGKGYLDASVNITKLDIPAKVDASMGDIHIYGNPHYWLSPENGKIISKTILDKLIEIQPTDADYFKKNFDEYIVKLDQNIKKWKEMLKPFAGTKIVTYHDSWPYFAKEFNLSIDGFIELKPGIPPSPAHVVSLIQKIKADNVKLILAEPFYDIREAERISKDAGIKYIKVASSVGAFDGTDSYIEMFDYNISKIVDALSK
jgi:ABC-type Zn uptake system ZnuABC Zn-binding protein ZnuA